MQVSMPQPYTQSLNKSYSITQLQTGYIQSTGMPQYDGRRFQVAANLSRAKSIDGKIFNESQSVSRIVESVEEGQKVIQEFFASVKE